MCIIGIARAEKRLDKIIDQWKHIELKSNSNDLRSNPDPVLKYAYLEHLEQNLHPFGV